MLNTKLSQLFIKKNTYIIFMTTTAVLTLVYYLLKQVQTVLMLIFQIAIKIS